MYWYRRHRTIIHYRHHIYLPNLSNRLSNCVGYKNYRYFVLFLFWVTIACIHVSIICIPQLFSEGSYLYPYNEEPIITQIINHIISQWNKILDMPATEYPLIGIYFRLYHDIERKYNFNSANTTTAIVTSSITPSEALQSAIISTTTIRNNMSNIVQSSLSSIPTISPSSPPLASEGESIRLYEIFFKFYQYWPNENLFVFATFILASSVYLATGSLLLFHIYLIYIGKTTIEYMNLMHIYSSGNGNGAIGCNKCSSNSGSSNNAFNINYDVRNRMNNSTNHYNSIHKYHGHRHQRGFKENFIEVFGNVSWYLALLPSIQLPPITNPAINGMMRRRTLEEEDEEENDFTL